jgi:SAM-dependent methyltransferase
VARYANAIVRALVEAFVHGMPARRPLRFLEIGAGTGGTTASVLPVLPPERTVYDFTDVSDLFLARAEGKFAAHPFVRYGRLDIENGPTAQGYPPHGFDVVLAANVIHATRDLQQVLRHVRELLTPGGLLLLYETTGHPRWFDVTLGLIEGWQRFADDDLRRDHPVLAVEQWQTLLRAAGFTDVAAFPEAAGVADLTFQHILIARAARSLEEDATGPAIAAPAAEPGRPAAARARVAQHPSRTPGGELARRVASAAPHDRWDLLVAATRTEVGRVLRLDPANPPDRRQRLIDLGLDSLMAVELRDRLDVALGLDRALPATLVFDHPTVDAIAAFLAKELFGWPAAAPNRAANRPAETGEPSTEAPDRLRRAEEIAQLGEDEVEVMLMKRLKERSGR